MHGPLNVKLEYSSELRVYKNSDSSLQKTHLMPQIVISA